MSQWKPVGKTIQVVWGRQEGVVVEEHEMLRKPLDTAIFSSMTFN